MDLFNNTSTNLLPYDGEVNYYGKLLNFDVAQAYFENFVFGFQSVVNKG